MAEVNTTRNDEVMEVEKALWLLGEVDTSDSETYGKPDSIEAPIAKAKKRENSFESFSHEHTQAKHKRAKKVGKDSKAKHFQRTAKKAKKNANDEVRAKLKDVRSELANVANEKEAVEFELTAGNLTYDAYEGMTEHYESICAAEHDLKISEMRLARSSPSSKISRTDLKNL